MDSPANWSDEDAQSDGEAAFLQREDSQPIYSVYLLLHRVRRLVLASIDDPYTLDHFRQPSLNTLIVRPLVDRLFETDDISVVYCLLANRVFFLREQQPTVAHQSVNVARATLCELVATRVLRRFNEDCPGPDGLLRLAHMLVEGFDPFQGAPGEVEREGRHLQWPIQPRGGHERKFTALELAIVSESKSFISSNACQRLVDAIHRGQVVYTPLSFVDILPDHYKYRPVSLYDPRGARLLNHQRLIVPRVRAIVELTQFLVLVALYVLTMVYRTEEGVNEWEVAFAAYTAGWVLQEFASVFEHGWELHSQSLWSFLDVTFIAIFSTYAVARVYDIFIGSSYGIHILCVAAPVLLTRIAFNIMPHNIVFISLHAMMRDFTVMTVLAIWCFTGFLLALMWLIDAKDKPGTQDAVAVVWPTVGKWLLWIWFGLDGTGIAESVRFNVVLGPVLMIAFAFLGNTLFLTILVAILTNTFSKIVANEASEIRFRRTVTTFEGVKSDSLFAYPPPLNLVAMVTMLPLKFLVSPRLFHTINVALIRVINAPLLLAISIFERQRLWSASTPRSTKRRSLFSWHFSGFSPHGDINGVFKTPLPDDLIQKMDALDPMSDVPVLEDDVMSCMSGDVPRSRLRRPLLSQTRREYPRARPRRRSPDEWFLSQARQDSNEEPTA